MMLFGTSFTTSWRPITIKSGFVVIFSNKESTLILLSIMFFAEVNEAMFQVMMYKDKCSLFMRVGLWKDLREVRVCGVSSCVENK